MENIFRNHEVNFDGNYARSMRNFPIFLWDLDEFLDIIIRFNQVKYVCFEPEIPKDLIMNLKKIEMYFLCTWYFYQKKVSKIWMLFANNMMRGRPCSFKYLMALTNNTYLAFITRFASFLPNNDVTLMRPGLYKIDIQTNILASRVAHTRQNTSLFNEDNAYMDYNSRWINYDNSSAIPSLMHKLIMRVHLIQHAFRTEIEASFLWYACLYIALEDLLCISTWIELIMFSYRIYDIESITKESLLNWKKCCYDLSLGIMSFGRGTLKLLNIIVDCDINGLDFCKSLNKKNIEIPPESLLGFIGTEIFRLKKHWFPVYSKYRKTSLKRLSISSSLTYSSKIYAYAPIINQNDEYYGSMVVNGMASTFSSMIFNYDFILLEGQDQIMCDPKGKIRDKFGASFCDYQWIFGCDIHTQMMTKIVTASYKGGFEKSKSAIAISLFPVNYKYLYDNSENITKLAYKFQNADVKSHIRILTLSLHDILFLTCGQRLNSIFIDLLNQPCMIKTMLGLCWLFQFNYTSLVNAIAATELLLLVSEFGDCL